MTDPDTDGAATARAGVERIGTLADRLRGRFGREFGRCRTCGKPTRSHRVGDGLQCHACHVDERPVALPDGGQPDPDGAVPPAKQCSMPDCPNAAVDPTRNGALCRAHHPELEDGDDQDGADPPASSDTNESGKNPAPEGGSPRSTPTPDADESASSGPDTEDWGGVDFATVDPDTYPPALLKREQWMGRLAGEKMPFSPWADRDHPEADPDSDARYKWGLSENYVDGETVAMAETDPRLDGRIFIQRGPDPFAFVDGDDVRCPETGAVHPEFVRILDRLGATYADVSTSGAGVHAYYRGELPNDQGQATFEIDTEPWGENDDPPTVEVYANKHVCVATGEHVDGTPGDVHPWDPDAVETVLGEYDALKKPTPEPDHDTDRDLDLDDHDADATERDETTSDARDIALAVDRLRPRDLPLRTRQVDTDTTGWEQWDPSSYRTSQGNDSLHRPPGEPVFHDHKHGEPFGVLSLFAAEQGILSKPWDRLAGADWWEAVDAARDAGAPIPEYEGAHGGGEPDTEGDHRVDPVEAEAVFEPRHAWEAARRVEADDLDEPLPEFADAPDVVRAVALAEDFADDLTEASALDAAAYFDLYDRARTEYGAPLPVYVDATRTVDDLEATRAAVENLKAWHILDEVESEITVEDPAGDALAKLNPTWEDSDSGERIVAFASGLFWCAAHDQVIDPLRLVALEAGVIDDETARLDGGDYLDVYELARTEYDAPLPAVSWLDSELTPDPEHAAVLPPAEELVGEFATDRDGLGAARDGVEDLYLDLARDTDTDAVLSAEPNTGKSTAAVKSATKEPTLLLAPRRTLQKEYVETANDPEVVGDSPPETYTLPVFAEPWEGVSREAAEQGVAAVREDPDGFDLLKDGAALREAVEERLDPDEPLEATDPGADTVVLDRATDDTAAGEYGPEWALRASTAHALGLRPQTIHQRDEELFGEPLPCNHDHDHEDEERAACSYTEAYEYVTDPERPIDLLIGSRVHAKVESAKTYHYTEDDQPRKQPRAVAIDEDVVGDYMTEWGPDARHVATWLAAALTDTVEDGHDLARQADRLRDGWVFDWVCEQGDEHLPDLERRATIADALVTVARASDRSPAAERAREVVLREGTVDTETAVAVLEELLDTPRRDLGEHTIQALRRLDEDGALRDALADVHTDGPLGAFTTPDLEPGEAFVEAARRPFDLLADAPEDDPEDYLDHLDAATATLRDLVAGGADGTRELVVRARDGYAHPDAYLLLAGAIGGDEDPLRAHSGGVAGRDEPTRANRVCLGDAKIVYDRNGDGAVVIDPPAFTGGGGDCSVVGLDATPRPSLWEQFAGLDAEVVSPFDGLEERREFVEETRNLQVVQTEHRAVNTYSGDPTGKSFDKDRELVGEVSEKFGGHQLRRDSLTTTGSPAVVSTKTLVGEGGYLRDELEDDAADFAHYWDIAGRNDLGKHKLAVLLGAPHPGDQAIERAALLAGEEIDPEGHGTEKDYNSEVANAMLAHAWQDQVTQAVHRFGRDKDGAVVFVHSAAVDEERLPVVANGGVTTAWSDAGKTVRNEILPYLRAGAEFTVDDVVEAVEYGRRAVQQKLAEFERLGYVDRLVGGPGRANVFVAVADPGENGHVELEGVDVSPGVAGEKNERPRNGTQYTSPFGLAEDSPGSDPPIPPERPTLPPPTAAEPARSGSRIATRPSRAAPAENSTVGPPK